MYNPIFSSVEALSCKDESMPLTVKRYGCFVSLVSFCSFGLSSDFSSLGFGECALELGWRMVTNEKKSRAARVKHKHLTFRTLTYLINKCFPLAELPIALYGMGGYTV